MRADPVMSSWRVEALAGVTRAGGRRGARVASGDAAARQRAQPGAGFFPLRLACRTAGARRRADAGGSADRSGSATLAWPELGHRRQIVTVLSPSRAWTAQNGCGYRLTVAADAGGAGSPESSASRSALALAIAAS